MNQSHIPNKVIILGGSHHNGLGLIRSLGEIGCKVYFISTSSQKNFVVKSKYIIKYWYAKEESDILDILLNKFQEEKYKPIIFPSDDNTAGVIDKNINLLKNIFIVPNIDNEDNAILEHMDKKKMNTLAQQSGLTVPKSCILQLDDIKNISFLLDKNEINYPCIIKPLRSLDGSKTDITIVNNTSELKECLEKKIKGCYKEVILQEFIDKDYELGIQGLSTIESDEVIITSTIKKIRESSIAPSATYAKVCSPSHIHGIDKIKSFIKRMNYKGLFDLDFIYSDGQFYFIEVNFRNGAYGYALTKAGVNLPQLWCLDAIGKSITEKEKKINNSIVLMSEFSDFKHVLSKNINILKWLKQFICADVHLIFNYKDIKPFFYKFIYR